eukprot:gene26179-47924_t
MSVQACAAERRHAATCRTQGGALTLMPDGAAAGAVLRGFVTRVTDTGAATATADDAGEWVTVGPAAGGDG